MRPSGLVYNDWEYRGVYLVSRLPYPITLQFQADVQDVTEWDDMFCTGLAYRIAVAIVEQLTQSTAVMQKVARAYDEFMGEARTIAAVEQGADEPAMDDYLTCRL